MSRPITQSEYYQTHFYHGKKDRNRFYHVLECDIRLLSSEILRLSKMPYSSWRNKEKIISLDKQIQYMEELLAAYERDQKRGS